MPRAVGSPTNPGSKRERRNFAKSPEILQVPNLIGVQKDSFSWFQTAGIGEVFTDFPILDKNGRYELRFHGQVKDLTDRESKGFTFQAPKYTPDECREKGLTYQSSLLADVELIDRETGEILTTELTYLGEFPTMTDRATFVINGSDRVVVSLLQRSPGVYFSVAERRDKEVYYSAEIKPHRGAPLSFEFDRSGAIQANVNRSRKVPVTMFLRALDIAGITEWIDNELVAESVHDIARANQDALVEIVDRQLADALSSRILETDEAIAAAIAELASEALVALGKDRLPSNLREDLIAEFLSGEKVVERTEMLEERLGVKISKLRDKVVELVSSKEVADNALRAIQEYTGQILDAGAAMSAVQDRLAGKTITGGSDKSIEKLKKDIIKYLTGADKNEALADKVLEATGVTMYEILDEILRELKGYSREDLRKYVIDTERERIKQESDRRLLEIFGDAEPIALTIERERADAPVTPDEAVVELHRRLRPGDQINAENARLYLESLYFSDRYDLKRVGRYQMSKKFVDLYEEMGVAFGDEQTTLTVEDIVATLRYLCNLRAEVPGFVVDDVDHLGNRRIGTVGELLQNQFRVGFSRMVRTITDRMSQVAPGDQVTPGQLINIKPIAAVMKEFFNSSQLSQFMDQTNPVAGLAHKRRLSAIGRGGIRSAREAKIDVRDVHPSHYGRICPIETPEGMNIGLIGSLATYARINDYGFVETPYRKVVDGSVTDEIIYLTADQEERYVIAQANEPFDAKTGKFLNETVLCRVRGAGAEGQFGEPDDRSPAEVDYMDVSPRQMVSAVSALIPFLEHDDANRALMGANMQRQAVPLLIPNAPLVGTGLEESVAHDSGDLQLSTVDGQVTYVDSSKIVVRAEDGTDVTFEMPKFRRSNQNTCVNHRPLVKVGECVEVGTTLADGPSTEQGELALGQNLLVAFMPWEGYNFEDAIIVSERVVAEDLLTSVHIKQYEVEARDTKVGPEEITSEVPSISEEMRAKLDEDGIIRIGTEVHPGDFLVGKVTPKGESGEQTAEQRLLRQIFGEKAHDVRDTSLKVPHGVDGRVIAVQHVRAGEDGVELKRGVNEMVRVFIAQKRKIQEGDKLAGRHGNKGVISKVLPVEDMPFLADGTPIDIILNPLGVPSRMNVGQLLETHLGWAARAGWSDEGGSTPVPANRHVATPVFDGAKENEIVDVMEAANRNLQLQAEDLYGSEVHADFVPKVNSQGKAVLMDGRNGEPFNQPITVGEIYMLKLHHLVDDKIHARSVGPYSLVTQQPLGGKAQFGGQRFGEMEVWALYAYGAAYLLREIFTVKSDDLKGRTETWKAIVNGDNVPEPGMPESFNVLVRELGSLGLKLDAYTDEGDHIDLMLSKSETRRRTQPAAQASAALAGDADMGLEALLGATAAGTDSGTAADTDVLASLLAADINAVDPAAGGAFDLSGESTDDLAAMLLGQGGAMVDPSEEAVGGNLDIVDMMIAAEDDSSDSGDEEE